MPNHVTTVILGYSAYNEETEERRFDVAKFNAADLNLCEAVTPMPAELRNSDSPPRNELTAAELVAGFGFPSWYEWANETWGTKWGTYNTKAVKLGGDSSPVMVEFQSAWGSPNAETLAKIVSFLESEWGLENTTIVELNPYDNSTEVLFTKVKAAS